MQSKPDRAHRRSFFKKMALLGGALVLTPLAGIRSAKSGQPDSAPQAQQTGYRLTPHIRKYYETAAK